MSETLTLPLWRRLCTTPLWDLVRGQLSGRLDWRAVVARANLPEPCADAVLQTVRKTRLWSRERVDVARELIGHFQEGLAHGRTPQQLVDDFGDVPMAAKLIRRAKLRCRPLRWQVGRWLNRAAAAALLLYLLWLVRVWWGRPSLETDYVAIANSHVKLAPAGEAAADDYRQAVATIQQWRKAHGQQELGYHDLAKTFDEDAWPQTVEMLRENRAALNQIRAGAAKNRLGQGATLPEGEQPVDEPPFLIAVSLAHLNDVRLAVALLEADAVEAADAGDAERVTADVAAILAAAQQLNESPFLLSGIIAVYCAERGYQILDAVLQDHPQLLSDRHLQQLAHRIAAYRPDWTWWFDTERLTYRDVIQRIYTDSGHGNGTVTWQGLQFLSDLADPDNFVMVSGDGPWTRRNASWGEKVARMLVGLSRTPPVLAVALADRQEMASMARRVYDYELRNWDQPLYADDPDDVDPEVDINHWSTDQRIRYLPLTLLVPAFDAARGLMQRVEGSRDGALIGLALEMSRRERGQWPTTLKELAPRWLPAVPVDRTNGAPLKYRVVGDRPLVYSVGIDLDDDGGTPVAPDGQHDSRRRINLSGFRGVAPDWADDGDWILWGESLPAEDDEPDA
ncbi:MAG: hypothetical protein CMJ58_21580 [Planctomycetaceae bacterium]|nr:hypothetical protein [Planctomycetaceae bacterium]